ncbi:MAG TPA: DNA-protecting protein DprA [Nitrospiraceae bacterium]|nr:DNA-protecting protein DprA [Nitrospiraceae bacterium]
MSDVRYWIGLTLVPEIGPVTAKQLISHAKSPENIFRLDRQGLLALQGMTDTRAENIMNFSAWDDVDKQVKRLEQQGVAIVCYGAPEYPRVLQELPDAPMVIYMRGSYQPDDRFGIAVVGSRTYSAYGEAVAQKISGELAVSGFTVISGLARGIDSFAHRSALASGGRTIAVLGSGIDVCYPSENRGLMEKIAASGCVMSEFSPGTPPNRENFPRRNRLISGLSLGVLVVEAATGSGSLITAALALEQNREVFAVPGNITAKTSAGVNLLIRQGAKMVLKTEDIIEELAPVLKGFIRNEIKQQQELTADEQQLCTVLSGEAKHIDVLARESGLPVHRILDILLSLELKGVIRQSDGKRFYLA